MHLASATASWGQEHNAALSSHPELLRDAPRGVPGAVSSRSLHLELQPRESCAREEDYVPATTTTREGTSSGLT